MSAASSSSSSCPSCPIKLVLGCMEFGRYASTPVSLSLTCSFLSSGHCEVDTASIYSKGDSEKIIGSLPEHVKNKIVIHTKANPWWTKENGDGSAADDAVGLTPSGISAQMSQSIRSLQLSPNPSSPPIDIYYLHAPHHTVPILDSLTRVQCLYQQGYFKRLGLSNYSAWQVAEIVGLCETRAGWVKPTVYQGMYNAITRDVERELFPCLRNFKIAFYLYNPLAGGILTGKYQSIEEKGKEAGNRFHLNDGAKMYSDRYWKQPVFDSISRIQSSLKESYPDGSVSLTSASLRWLLYHSKMSAADGDAIILGASKLEHLEENVRLCHEGKGPLDPRVVEAFDQAWAAGKATVTPYFR